MEEIRRLDIDENWADSAIIEAGDFVFVGYCMGNEGETTDKQITGALDALEKRLREVGLTLDAVVKMDCLFRDIADLTLLPPILRARLAGKYPARKAYATTFIRDSIAFQIDAIAYRGKR